MHSNIPKTLVVILTGTILSLQFCVINQSIHGQIPDVSNITRPTISISSLKEGQEVPVGEQFIVGNSSDNEKSNCQVYADVNDITPLQNATAAGISGGDDDFSQWTFKYTEDYQMITEGVNKLTATISCYDGNSPTPFSESHSINVTGEGTDAPIIPDEPITDELTDRDNDPTVIDNETTISESGVQSNLTQFQTYEDDEFGFSIQYPSDWTTTLEDLTMHIVVSFSPPENDATVDVKVFPRGEDETLRS
jgi:hypothetical protein